MSKITPAKAILLAAMTYYIDTKGEDDSTKECRNCSMVYVPLDSDLKDVSICLRCKYPNLEALEYAQIKKEGDKK